MHEKMTDDVYAHVGKRLRALRTESRLTQSDVAKIINVSPQQYQKYEDAQSKCSLNYILALADHYAVPIEDVLPVSPSAPIAAPKEPAEAVPGPQMEADLLARLVSSYVKLATVDAKLRLVQLVEAIVVKGEASENA